MPFQVGRFRASAVRPRTVWRVILLLASAAVPVLVLADGGFYSDTKHGSTTLGVQRDTALPRGSCVQCHTSHGDNVYDFGLWTANDNNLCFTCHASPLRSFDGQTSYALSGHSTSGSSLNGRPVGMCVQCHNPHGNGDSRGVFPNQTAHLEEQDCFTCHGSGFRPQDALDIQAASTRRYAHAVGDYQRIHNDAAEFGALGSSPNPTLSGSSRHVECMDCHNTHLARSTPRAARTSNIGENLLGSWGVRPIYSGIAWLPPSSYVVERFQTTATEYESYLCLKCHSNYSYGNSAPYTADGLLESNTALEVSPNNPAYHNVTGQMESAVPSEDLVNGTAGPPAFINQWGPNSAMACSDCHASDPGTGTARGSHGSIYSFMLKKRFKAQASAVDNTGRTGTQSDLCYDCHEWNTYGQGGSGTATNFSKGTDNLHTKDAHASAGCFQCHSAVPHGFKRKHMIVYATDGAPYYQSDPINYALKKGGIQAYSHATGGNYTINNCKAGCHDGHQVANPVNPLP